MNKYCALNFCILFLNLPSLFAMRPGKDDVYAAVKKARTHEQIVVNKEDATRALSEITCTISKPNQFQRLVQCAQEQRTSILRAAQKLMNTDSDQFKQFLLRYTQIQCRNRGEGNQPTFIAGRCPTNSEHLWYLFLAKLNIRDTIDESFGTNLASSIQDSRLPRVLNLTAYTTPTAHQGVILLLPPAINGRISSLTKKEDVPLHPGADGWFYEYDVLEVKFSRPPLGSFEAQNESGRPVLSIESTLYFRNNGSLVKGYNIPNLGKKTDTP